MNVLHVSAVKNWGGGENHIEALCLEGPKADPAIKHLILCVREGEFHKKLKNKNLDFVTSPLAIKMDLRFAFKVISLCKKRKIDLIHIHDPAALALTIMADKLGKLPPMIFSKKTSFPIKDRKQTLYKYNYPKIKTILCVSEETRRVSSERITDTSKLKTVYHGINLANQNGKPPFDLREKLNISEERVLVGNIGNHIRAKHLETLVEVVNDIVNKRKRKDFFFVQMGVFTDRTEALKEKVKEYQIEDHIKFLGFVPGASNLIPQFDMTLVTSQSEGLPGVIYESFYHGTSVVSTNVGGIPEVIDNGVNGLLAEKHDHQTLSDHLLYLSGNPELKKKFTEISQQKLNKNFTSSVMAGETIKEYKKIVYGL